MEHCARASDKSRPFKIKSLRSVLFSLVIFRFWYLTFVPTHLVLQIEFSTRYCYVDGPLTMYTVYVAIPKSAFDLERKLAGGKVS